RIRGRIARDQGTGPAAAGVPGQVRRSGRRAPGPDRRRPARRIPPRYRPWPRQRALQGPDSRGRAPAARARRVRPDFAERRPVAHLRQGSELYGADRALLALSASTPSPYLPIVGAIARPGTAGALEEEARRRGLRAVRFESGSRIDFRCARAVARVALAQGVR